MEELNKGYEFTKAQIAELESLRAENVSLKLEQSMRKMAEQSNAKLLAENQSLKTELEAARKDAERYRWLRSFRPGLWLDGITLEPIENEGYALQLDFAIDSAIEQAKSCNELHEKGGVK